LFLSERTFKILVSCVCSHLAPVASLRGLFAALQLQVTARKILRFSQDDGALRNAQQAAQLQNQPRVCFATEALADYRAALTEDSGTGSEFR